MEKIQSHQISAQSASSAVLQFRMKIKEIVEMDELLLEHRHSACALRGYSIGGSSFSAEYNSEGAAA